MIVVRISVALWISEDRVHTGLPFSDQRVGKHEKTGCIN